MNINQQFEIQRDRTIQNSLKELLQFSVSDLLISEVTQKDSMLGESLKKISSVNSKEDLSVLKLFLNDNKTKLGSTLYSDLKEEIGEISEDFKWSRSKDGKLILKIERWIEEQRFILNEKWSKELIYIGRSLDEPISLIIGGFVSPKVMDEIKSFFDSKTPPIPITYKLYDSNYNYNAVVCTGKELVQTLTNEIYNGKNMSKEIKSLFLIKNGGTFRIISQNVEGVCQSIEAIQIIENYDKYSDLSDAEFRETVFPKISADYLEAISQAINDGYIRFSKDAVIILDAYYTGDINVCKESDGRCQPIAQRLADISGASVIALSGQTLIKQSVPSFVDGQFTTNDKAFYMFRKGEVPKELEKDINMDEFIAKMVM